MKEIDLEKTIWTEFHHSAASSDASVPFLGREPKDFLIEKLNESDVLLLGTKHSRPCTFDFLTEMLPMLSDQGVTHIGLEIGSDQQPNLEDCRTKKKSAEDVEVFHVIDVPEYRLLLEEILKSDIKPVALDLPRSMFKFPVTRDQWMAQRVGNVFDSAPDAKILVIVGNLHALKEVRWQDPRKKNLFLAGHLSKDRPDLELCSILGECVEEEEDSSSLREMISGGYSPVAVETEGIDLELGTLQLISAQPMRPREVADALIVHYMN